MTFLFVLGPFLVVGIAVIVVAFAGGASAARDAYLTRGGKVFAIVMVILYLGLGIAVPAAVIANRQESLGGVGSLRSDSLTTQEEHGKELFRQTCWSCHNLDAADARGVTGPDLDELGGVDRQRVLNAIKNGGTGQGRMPAGLLSGQDAQDVAVYVEKVAGQ